MERALTREWFEPTVGQSFTVWFGPEDSVELRLAEAVALSENVIAGGRAPFSLVFVGPRDRPLEQRIYRMENAELGSIDIFIVPIGPRDDGLAYEAIFN